MRDSLRALRLVASTALRADPWRALAVLVLEPLGAATGPLLALWLKHLTDGVVAGDRRGVVLASAALAGSLALMWLAGGAGNRMRLTLAERVGFAFDRRLAELSAGLDTIEHHERPDYQDRLALLRDQQGALGAGVNAVVQGVRTLVPVVLTMALLAALHPALVLLPAFAVPSFLVLSAAQRWQRRAEEESASSRRLGRHLYELTLTAGPAKELRVFGLRDEIMARHRAAWLDSHRVGIAAQRRTSLWSALGLAVFALGFAGAVALVVQRAVAGQATAGDVLLAVGLARQVNASVTQTVFTISGLQQSLRAAGRLLWLVDYARQPGLRRGTLPAPAALREGVVFDRVSFRYPGTEEWVLRDVSVRLAPGSVVALVGENGAGKTSLVKLLCGMYRPTEGRILVDGVDLNDLDPASWRERLSAGFQDFARLELVAREAVGVGDLPRIADDAAVRGALALAGATDVVDRLPRGLDTQLGRTWAGGVDLSTGQWQRLALGRAFLRRDPLVLVLDEPTASLDATTEHEVFERFTAAARRRAGGVTVLVSHRFSTVRAADLILVVEDGRVVERGSHHALVGAGGRYAGLYEIQAAAYR